MENYYQYQSIEQKIIDIVYKEKGSKFIAYCFPITKVDEIKSILTILQNEHPKARHICYAYRLGLPPNEIYRANDDGEPNGTAGLPIYQQILSFNLTNILVVSVRYFGGTKLGVSGLIKAYKTNAKEALTACTIINKELEEICTLQFPYEKLSEIMRICKKYEVIFESNQYNINYLLIIRYKKRISERLISDLEMIEHLIIQQS